MKANELSELLAQIFTSHPEIHLVYLFGSQVDGQTGPMSDYDLGVLLKDGSPNMEIHAELSHEFAKILQTDRIDVVLLDNVPIEFAYHIIAGGKLLYERDVETRVEYEANIMGRYFDYLPVLHAQRDQILQGDEYDRRVQRYREAFGRTERTLGQIKTPKK
jgi:uncharacterized protein